MSIWKYGILLSTILIGAMLLPGCGERSLPPEDSLKLQLEFPVEGEVVMDISGGLDWESYPGAEEYRVRLWDDSGSLLLDAVTDASSYNPDFALPDGEYRWAAAVIDGGESVHWSDTATFHLSQIVVQSLPDFGAVINDLRVYLDWYNFPQANGYRIIVWEEGDPENPVYDGYEFASSVKPAVPLFDGDYCWTVGVKYAAEDSFGRWSDTLCFRVDQYPYRLVDTMRTRGYPRDVLPCGNVLYVADGSAGLLAADRTDPLHPEAAVWDEPTNQYENRALWIDLESELLVVADYRGNPPILWYDISSPLAPVQTEWAGLFARRTQDVAGTWFRDTLYVGFADYDDGAFAYDLRDTVDYFVMPRGAIDPNGFTFGVAFSESLFFSAAGQVGVFIADTRNADSIIANLDTPGEADKMFVDGEYLYIADGLAGLTVADISDPADPFIIGRADPQTGSAQDVKVVGDYCFVSSGSGGTHVYDISDPTAPVAIQEIDGMYSYAVAAAGDILYVADRDWGIVTLSR